VRARGTAVVRARGERGSGLVEFTWLAILLMVPLLYVVLTEFEVQRAAFGTTTAARAAARAFSQAPDEPTARERARAAVAVALADQGMDRGAQEWRAACRPDPGNCLAPGSVVVVDVTYAVPLPLLPDVLGGQRPSVRVAAQHTVPYGTYREDR
jgi:hypothetical protein